MRPINLLGLLLYIECIRTKHSLRGLLVFINGLIYHSLYTEKNKERRFMKIIRFWDIICNTIMTYYTIYNFPHTRIYAVIACKIFLLNLYLVNKLPYYVCDFIHVLGIQYPLSLGLKFSS